MAEGIGLGGGPPQPNHLRLYEQWAQGGWGMIISGEFPSKMFRVASYTNDYKGMYKSIASILPHHTT